jgi:hypothetical protein
LARGRQRGSPVDARSGDIMAFPAGQVAVIGHLLVGRLQAAGALEIVDRRVGALEKIPAAAKPGMGRRHHRR